MLFDFFFTVRRAGVPASPKEFMALIEALDRGVVQAAWTISTSSRASAW